MPYLETHNNERKCYYCDSTLQAVTEDEKRRKSFRQKLGEHKYPRDAQERKRKPARNLRPKGQQREGKPRTVAMESWQASQGGTWSKVTGMWQSWDRNPCCRAQYSYALLSHSDAFTLAANGTTGGPLRTTLGNRGG